MITFTDTQQILLLEPYSELSREVKAVFMYPHYYYYYYYNLFIVKVANSKFSFFLEDA
jgi:hypothetical protein